MAAPQVQVYPWGDEYLPIAVALVRPYFLGRFTLESPVTQFELRPSVRLGIGSEVQFFGLYQTDLSLGMEISGSRGTEVNFRITGLKF